MSDVTPDLNAIENDPKGMRKLLEEIGPELKTTKDALAEANATIAGFQRDKAFGQAGVPEGDPDSVFDLFRQSYKGELNPESIKEAFGKLGIPEPTTPPPVAAPPAGETAPAVEAPEVDPQTAAIVADSQELRTSFSPPLTDVGEELVKAMETATSPAELEQMLRQAGAPMSN